MKKRDEYEYEESIGQFLINYYFNYNGVKKKLRISR